MECTCGKSQHEPWCAAFVAGVDTGRKIPANEREKAAAERAINEQLARMAERLGESAFDDLAMAYLLSREEYLRRVHPPDHPALQLIDEWRSEQRGF